MGKVCCIALSFSTMNSIYKMVLLNAELFVCVWPAVHWHKIKAANVLNEAAKITLKADNCVYRVNCKKTTCGFKTCRIFTG